MKIRFTLLSLILALYSFQAFAVDANDNPYEAYYAEFYGVSADNFAITPNKQPRSIPASQNKQQPDSELMLEMADPNNFYNG